MEVQKIAVSNINPAAYNPRVDLQPGDPEYEKLRRSIEEFGFVEPLIWNERTGNLVGGHQRFKILVETGRTEVECSVVDLDDAREKALNIALNKISGDWDLPLLKDLLEELDTGDLDIELTGFDEKEIEDLMTQFHVPEEVEEDEFDAEEEAEKVKEPITKLGDIWKLGRHRLMCGDATNLSDIEKLMGGRMTDLVFTDPPYNVDYVGKTKDAKKIQNDKMENDSFYQFLYDSFVNMYTVTNPGCPIYICHADSEGVNFRTAMINAGWLMKQCIIWVKNTIVMGRQDYHWQHEPILYGWKEGKAHVWCGDRKQSTVWNFDKPSRNAEHPTMKPVGIPAKAMRNSSKPGDLVLDPFGGGRFDTYSCRTNRPYCLFNGIGPHLLRCYRKTMGAIHRGEGGVVQ